MKTIRYAFLMLFVLAPALAVAQDSVHVVIEGTEYPAWVSSFTPSFQDGVTYGPETVVQADDGIDVNWNACEPLTPESAAAVNGNIALVTRGACSFVLKVTNANAAGAVAVIVANAQAEGRDDNSLVFMGGTFDPDNTNIPAIAVSYNSGQAILEGILFGDEEATIEPKRIAPVPTAATIDNGTIVTSVADNGVIGAGFLGAPGFVLGEDNGLFSANFGMARVSGTDTLIAGNSPVSTTFVLEADNAIETLAGPYAAPFSAFTEAYRATFSSSDFGVRVIGTAYAKAGDPFIVMNYEMENISGGALDGVYAGIFGDFDIGADAGVNYGAYDSETQTIFAYDSSASSTNYFGITLINGGTVAGWSTEGGGDVTLQELKDEGMDSDTDGPAGDIRLVLGSGPFDLTSAGASVTFAIGAGDGQNGVLTAAQAAADAVGVATETTTPEGFYTLKGAYPNPVVSSAKIAFDVPTSQQATLKVYDVLGREVATLVDRVVSAGPQEVSFDATNLPSGVYLYRLEAGEAQLMQRMTVVR